MKNRISSILFTLILFTSFTYSQETYYSLEVGGIYSQANFVPQVLYPQGQLDPRPSYSIGANIGYVENDLELTIGVKYTNLRFYEHKKSWSRFDWGSPATKRDYSLHSISLPATIGYNFFNFNFPKIITGLEFGVIFDGYGKLYSVSNPCAFCDAEDQNNLENSGYRIRDEKFRIINDSQGFLNFFTGLSYDYNIFAQNLSLKFLYYLYTDNISLESEPFFNSLISYKKIDLMIGLKF